FKGGKIHLINGISLLISFFFARLMYGTYMTALYNRAEIPAPLFWTYAVGNVVLNGLNWFWYVLLNVSELAQINPKGSIRYSEGRWVRCGSTPASLLNTPSSS
ncbi:6417_t:CDS:2, partial [Acaulospora colombiana]